MQIPYQKRQNRGVHKPVCVFEIGFQHTIWNGKESSLREKICLLKDHVFDKNITNFKIFWNFCLMPK